MRKSECPNGKEKKNNDGDDKDLQTKRNSVAGIIGKRNHVKSKENLMPLRHRAPIELEHWQKGIKNKIRRKHKAKFANLLKR